MSEVVPLKIEDGFNADVIAEDKPIRTYTNETLDYEGWVFYTSAVRPEGALATIRVLSWLHRATNISSRIR